MKDQREDAMIRAFVFGKFLPFHKGHEALIKFALTKCNFLTVLVCCSNKETIPAQVRESWIKNCFTTISNIEVRSYQYLESELPNTSVSSEGVSRIWSERLKVLFPNHHLVITSEKYGDYVASFMEIEHISFDMSKNLIPVSATKIRHDLFAYWNYLPDSVKPYFAIKIVLLGTESTGKTTLSEELAKHYQCGLVKEVGRELIANSDSIEMEDLQIVAIEHARRIADALSSKHPLIIIDTDVHITMSYSKFILGTTLSVEDNVYKTNKADLYLYLDNKVDYVQDGTRLSEADRNLLDLSHREILEHHGIRFVEIGGDWEERMQRAVGLIDQTLEAKTKMHWA